MRKETVAGNKLAIFPEVTDKLFERRLIAMLEATELLKAYLSGVLRLSGAAAASVFVPTLWNRAAPAILIHTGQAPPLPELASVEVAQTFARHAATSPTEIGIAALPGGATVLPSEEPGGALLPIPLITKLWTRVLSDSWPGDSAAMPQRRGGDQGTGIQAAGWVGLRFATPEDNGSSGEGRSARERTTDFCAHLVALAGSLASYYVCLYGVLTDPLTGLPGRAELLGLLREELGRAREKQREYSLLFVNPDEFERVNEQFGRKAGDLVLQELVARLQAAVRRTDPLARYGAAVFAVGLDGIRPDGALAVGEKIRRRLSEDAYLSEGLRLDVSVGIASFDPAESDIDPYELVRRADVALAAAKFEGGARTSLWRSESDRLPLPPRDRLNGIFTGDSEKDYRNMGLLWDALSAIAAGVDPAKLAALVVDRMAMLRPDRVVLLEVDANGTPRLLCGRAAQEGEPRAAAALAERDVLPDELTLAGRAAVARRPLEGIIAGAQGAGSARPPLQAQAVPLLVDQRVVGILVVAGAAGTLRLGPDDLPFLTGFAAQLALALDHARLAERQRASVERERQQLRAELHDLRGALHQAKIVYRSEQFERLLGTLRRVAPTDTTVLISGESGTGKELVAQTIHRLSRRRQKPLVIVDCGSIPATLIESELFGHEKGAYTGAQERHSGRLVQASGGTLLLDEIGELPLEAQAKLLRFVQEKQFTAVGSTTPRHVDVRILAATNRDLESEARAGRFREDLYHRLNVVRLDVPPLRERPDDILHLARHFVEIYAVQFQKPTREFSAEAVEALLRDSWPGNVRELQNRVLQAMLLSDSDVLTPEALRLPRAEKTPERGDQRVEPPAGSVTQGSSVDPARRAERTTTPAERTSGGTVAGDTTPDPWTRLRRALAQEIRRVLDNGRAQTPPIGRWLEEDLVIEAHEAAGRVIRRTAARLGLPETTLARKLRKAEIETVVSIRTESWPSVREAIRALVRTAGDSAGVSVLDRAERVLVEEVIAHVPRDRRLGAQLLATSLPTFRLRTAACAPGA